MQLHFRENRKPFELIKSNSCSETNWISTFSRMIWIIIMITIRMSLELSRLNFNTFECSEEIYLRQKIIDKQILFNYFLLYDDLNYVSRWNLNQNGSWRRFKRIKVLKAFTSFLNQHKFTEWKSRKPANDELSPAIKLRLRSRWKMLIFVFTLAYTFNLTCSLNSVCLTDLPTATMHLNFERVCCKTSLHLKIES